MTIIKTEISVKLIAGGPKTMTQNNNANDAATTSHPTHRILQNFQLIWLDSDFNEADPHFKKSLENLHQTVTLITTFTDADECVDFMNEIEEGKIFLIVTGSLGQYVVPCIEAMSQLESVYVFCDNKVLHEEWVNKIPKVKGLYTEMGPIYEALQIDIKTYDRAMIPITFKGVDALFMYTQLLKEAILQIEDDHKKSIEEFADYCRDQNSLSPRTIKEITEKYFDHSPIWWYTGPYCIYSMLNYGLRMMDTDIIMKMGFFIRHLHNHMDKVHREQQAKNPVTTEFIVFRGQGLSHEYFENMKKSEGGLMAFNNFLSTSLNREVSIGYAWQSNPDDIAVLFVMRVDPRVCEQSSISFVDVKDEGHFNNENEILFATHSVFRIQGMSMIKDAERNPMWEVHLTLVGENEQEMGELTRHVRKEMGSDTGWSRLGWILIKIGQSQKAEVLYQVLLDKASSDKERGDYLNQLGRVYKNMGEYSKALSSHEQSLEIYRVALPPTHPDLATSYNNIAGVYDNMGEYSKALSSYERSLKIKKVALLPNHPSLATSYNNIGSVYVNMGEYPKALSSYERSLEIHKVALPANHPFLATSYNNIGNVYKNMGEYWKALSSYEQSLEILKVALPPNHPDLAGSYNNIGMVYMNMGEYPKALLSYERSLEIDKVALPANHPFLATSYNNIGSVYDNMGEYSKALSYYERSLEIDKVALPPNHPDLATSYNNIGLVYDNMGEYWKALSSYERSLEIKKMALPPNHPSLATSYNNIGEGYRNMGEYSKALSSYERSLEIYKVALPPNHPLLATSYNNIGSVYDNMGEYSKALRYYERSLEIKKVALPPINPSLATSYNNIGGMYKDMSEYSKALSYLQKAYDIRVKVLPSTHPNLIATKNSIEQVKKMLSK